MSSRPRPLLTFAMIALCSLPAVAQDQPAPPDPAGPQAAPEPQRPPLPDLDQPVPPDKVAVMKGMMQAGLIGMPVQIAKRYSLTDDQKTQATAIVQNFWAGVDENDKEQLLRVMYYSRTLVESGQAKPEHFQRLSSDALPVVERLFQQMENSSKQFEAILDDQQRVKFEADMEDFRTGQQQVIERAKLVASGEVQLGPNGEPADGWPNEDINAVRVRQEEVVETDADGNEVRRSVTRIRSKLPTRAVVAADERYWTAYVKGFIAKYGLNKEQTAQARRLLGDAITRAREYRRANKARFAELADRRKRDEAEKNVLDLEQLQKEEARIAQPIVNLFDDMDRQLQKLPTEQQRAGGADRGTLLKEEKKDGN
ncbi:MAG: hypothetical protein BIFFINMI_01207 [Phycisphaerae bacterium]|nr:hypothetical protein [Phycisphaerae bacterium]